MRGTEGAGPDYRQARRVGGRPAESVSHVAAGELRFVSTPDSPLARVLRTTRMVCFSSTAGARSSRRQRASAVRRTPRSLTPFPNAALKREQASWPRPARTPASRIVMTYPSGAGRRSVPSRSSTRAGTARRPLQSWSSPSASSGRSTTSGASPRGATAVRWGTAVFDELDSGGNDGVARARLSWLVDSASRGQLRHDHVRRSRDVLASRWGTARRSAGLDQRQPKRWASPRSAAPRPTRRSSRS